MPMDEDLQKKIFTGIQKLEWLKGSELDFVHIFKTESFPYMLPPTVYPDQDQKVEIKKTIEEIFNGITKELPYEQKISHCSFDSSPKEGMVSYLKEHKADLAIVLTREKHGLTSYFSSSFADHLVDHAPCNVLVIR
jgi:nucleotide-binding universal stress UspA family protein